MISAITYENIQEFGYAFSSQFRLRHKAFIQRQNYNVYQYNGMEYDAYDTPATVYLVYQCPMTGEALGVSRLHPVSQGCMLLDLWPNLIERVSLIKRPNTWESTRFCIEKNLPLAVRQKISRELVAAQIELGLEMGIQHIVGIMPIMILKSVFEKAGCEFFPLGPIGEVDGVKVQAAGMEISQLQLHRVMAATSLQVSSIINRGREYVVSRVS